jgi:hypothetical protein
MKKKKENEDPDRIKKLISYMDFAARLRIAQEDNKKNKKKPNK